MQSFFKKFIIGLMACCIFAACHILPVYASSADTDGNTANVVVFVNFSDTVHNHIASAWGKCFLEDPNIENLFNGSAGNNPKAFRQYIYNITYGAVQVANVFPQYNDSTGKITPFTLPSNTAAYADSRDLLVYDTVAALKNSGLLSEGINIDRNSDGIIDNLMIVVPCESGNSNTQLYGLYTTYAGNDYINGKRVAGFNIITESGAYLSNGQSGLPIHEYMHSLGYPDLYRSRSNGNIYTNNPVYTWDIMSSQSTYLQYPLAYNRSTISNSFTIPELTQSKADCSLYSVSAATPFSGGTENSLISSDIKNNQALIIKTGYSDSEFFVVEYRKQGTMKWVSTPGGGPLQYVDAAYDTKIPGSGLIIYRVNLALEKLSNLTNAPYYMYVFRPGDSYNTEGIENGGGDMTKSFLSLESGRTSYGLADTDKGLSDGAITYSDGHNSGIVISNVGSAAGDTISFSVTISDIQKDQLWSTEYSAATTEDNCGALSAMDSNGKIYVLPYGDSAGVLMETTGQGLSAAQGGSLSGDFAGWEMVIYNNTPYVSYCDKSSRRAKLARWTGSGWQSLWTSSYATNGGTLCADANGVYLVCIDENNSNIECFKYNGTSMSSLGAVATGCSYAVNPAACAGNGMVCVAYREFFGSDKTVVRVYKNGTWGSLGNINIPSSIVSLSIDNDYVYLGSAYDPFSGNKKLTVWKCPVNTAASWEKVGSDVLSDVSIAAMQTGIAEGEPYLAVNDTSGTCIKVYRYSNGEWKQVGPNAASENVNVLQTYYRGGYIWLVYPSLGLHKVLAKRIITQSGTAPEENDPLGRESSVDFTSLTLDGVIGLNFYAKLSPRVKYIIMDSPKGGEKRVYAEEFLKFQEESESSFAEYMFTYGVAAKEMKDTVTFSAYDASGRKISLSGEKCSDGKFNYSVMNYIDYVLATESGMAESEPQLYELCAAMKKYGHNSQVYFGYNSQGMDPVTDSAEINVSGYAPEINGSEPEGLEYQGTSLLLKSGTCIRHYFALENGASINDYSFFINETGKTPTLDEDGRLFYVEIDNIPAGRLGQNYELKVTKAGDGGETPYSVKYSALGYVYKVKNNSEASQSLKELCNSLYRYYNKALMYWP